MKRFIILGILCLASAIFMNSCTKEYTITVESNNANWGTVAGGGTYADGESIQISALAAEGYKFVKWNDGNTSNPRTITVTGDATYTAIFAQNNNGGNNGGNNNENGNGGEGNTNFSLVELEEAGHTSSTISVKMKIEGDISSETFRNAEYGFCYCSNDVGAPSLDHQHVACNNLDGSQRYSAVIDGLQSNSHYNINGYIRLANGNVIYGNEWRTFRTTSSNENLESMHIEQLNGGNGEFSFTIDVIANNQPQAAGFFYNTTGNVSEADQSIEIDFGNISMDDSNVPHIYVRGTLPMQAGTYYMRSWMQTSGGLIISDNEKNVIIQ